MEMLSLENKDPEWRNADGDRQEGKQQHDERHRGLARVPVLQLNAQKHGAEEKSLFANCGISYIPQTTVSRGQALEGKAMPGRGELLGTIWGFPESFFCRHISVYITFLLEHTGFFVVVIQTLEVGSS